MAVKGDQRLNAIRQLVRPASDALGAEDVDLKDLSREHG